MSKTLCKTLGKCRLLSIKKNYILRLSPIKPKSTLHTTQKMNFSIKDFFSKCDKIRWTLRIWSHFLKKSLMENFIFSAVPSEMNLTSLTNFWKYIDCISALSLF